MLNKNDIVKILKEVNLHINEYWILAGSGLVMHGVKNETRDIDIGCTKELFQKLIKKGFKFTIMNDGCRSINYNENIDLYEEWNVDKIEFIDELPVGSLESIKKHKIKLGREKDLKDVELIDEFIDRNNI